MQRIQRSRRKRKRMNDNETVKAYWKPEPRRHSFTWIMLLVPACIYVVGVMLYSHNAFIPGLAHENGHALGSTLMVVGGELGTLAAAAEVFRKYCVVTIKKTKDENGKETEIIERETNILDWFGLAVSLVATLGNLFVVYVSLAPDFVTRWAAFVREYGPLVLLLCSGVDFYAGVMEFGFLNASYERRYEKWLRDKRNYETKEGNKAREVEQMVNPGVNQETEESKPVNIIEETQEATRKLSKREMILELYNGNKELTQSSIAETVGVSRGYVSKVIKAQEVNQ